MNTQRFNYLLNCNFILQTILLVIIFCLDFIVFNIIWNFSNLKEIPKGILAVFIGVLLAFVGII